MIKYLIIIILLFWGQTKIKACSIFYFIDKATGKIYVANNEDYWYNVKAYIQITPRSKNTFARLWYGWDDFAQGGINEYGLFFDGAATPKQLIPDGYFNPEGRDVGDEILSKCKSVDEAINYLEQNKIALSEGHIIFGDKMGHAAVLEWINKEKKVITLQDNMLIATNFLLSDTSAGNFPCPRYKSIADRLIQLKQSVDVVDLKKVGNAIGGAVQLPKNDTKGKIGGTLYTSFINISDMELILVYKLDNKKITKLDLNKVFENKKRQKIRFK